jgi:hypothetical protein
MIWAAANQAILLRPEKHERPARSAQPLALAAAVDAPLWKKRIKKTRSESRNPVFYHRHPSRYCRSFQ